MDVSHLVTDIGHTAVTGVHFWTSVSAQERIAKERPIYYNG